MRSSDGNYWIALDHIRLLAAFMVFSWHFMHGVDGYPVQFEAVPGFIVFSLFDEGHTGVALFMALSGYLFAKLLADRQVVFAAFFYNRAVRLLPLLVIVMIINGVLIYANGQSLRSYGIELIQGLVLPVWPNGGWSIAVELHFYMLLPALLLMLRKHVRIVFLSMVLAVLLRTGLYIWQGETQSFAYWTIIGRYDQFIAGMLAFKYREEIIHRKKSLAVLACAFVGFFWLFNRAGGYYQMPSYPSASSAWIVLPLIEGVSYACFIAWYDSLKMVKTNGISGILGRMGTYSYAIYLLHPFFVFRASTFIHENLISLSNFNVALLVSLGCFILMMPIGHLSFKLVEEPFLRRRKRY